MESSIDCATISDKQPVNKFHGLFFEQEKLEVTSPRKKFAGLFKEAEVVLKLPRSRSESLMEIFSSLPKDGQEKILFYAKKVKETSQLEQDVGLTEPVSLSNDIPTRSGNENTPRRKKRSHTHNTVRRNYSLSEEIAEAIQAVSKAKNMSASLYIEKTMASQSDVVQIINAIK